jgi:hypothetical protein
MVVRSRRAYDRAMSSSIDLSGAVSILLADGWHNVDPDSLEVEAFTFENGAAPSTASETCFRFRTSDRGGKVEVFWGPLSSVVAVSNQVHTPVPTR